MIENVKIESLLGEYEIEMPGNGISEVGIDAIQRYLYGRGYQCIPDIIRLPDDREVDWVWDWKIGGKGEYVGALPKRIAKYTWQTHKKKLTREELTEIGNLGASHSGRHAIHYFDVVNKINWEATDFGQPSSCCFWSCHASAKDMILGNGGGAIRFFRDNEMGLPHNYSQSFGFARAWLAPWHDCWVVFNGYGLETLAIARILAAHLGHAYYRRIGLNNFGASDGDLWINATKSGSSLGSGFLIGPQSSVLEYGHIDLKWKEISKKCSSCGGSIEGHGYSIPDDEIVCETCFHEEYFTCDYCGRVGQDSYPTENGTYCETCFHRLYATCVGCDGSVLHNDSYSAGSETYCEACFDHLYAICAECGELISCDDIQGEFCSECAEKIEETPCATS